MSDTRPSCQTLPPLGPLPITFSTGKVVCGPSQLGTLIITITESPVCRWSGLAESAPGRREALELPTIMCDVPGAMCNGKVVSKPLAPAESRRPVRSANAAAVSPFCDGSGSRSLAGNHSACPRQWRLIGEEEGPFHFCACVYKPTDVRTCFFVWPGSNVKS